jgi:hypothetical protein
MSTSILVGAGAGASAAKPPAPQRRRSPSSSSSPQQQQRAQPKQQIMQQQAFARKGTPSKCLMGHNLVELVIDAASSPQCTICGERIAAGTKSAIWCGDANNVCGLGFCVQIGVGMFIKLKTQLTHELHRLERFNQIADRFRTIGPSCRSGSHIFVATYFFVLCCLFYFRPIYNEWFVTKCSRSSWSNTAGVLKRTSMSAC